VLAIKHKIAAVKGFEPSQQKLLRKGALIQDEKTVAEIGIQEGDFLVVMVNVKV
jgi:UV excision repair protein RAD23